jgi:Uma2 family endonuclease
MEEHMPSLAAEPLLTPEEYLASERKATLKNEYLNGKILAMSGASRAHNLITLDIATELNIQLRGQDCEVYTSDMRVQTSPTGAYFYPDVVVVCDKPRFEDNVFDTLLNPIFVVEVLSPSTEANDRGEKFARYQELASLREYILVSQDRIRVEHYHLIKTQWVQTEFHTYKDVLPLVSIDCKLPLRDIYRRVPEVVS